MSRVLDAQTSFSDFMEAHSNQIHGLYLIGIFIIHHTFLGKFN